MSKLCRGRFFSILQRNFVVYGILVFVYMAYGVLCITYTAEYYNYFYLKIKKYKIILKY